MKHNYLLTEVWISGKQELLDNPVQMVWVTENIHINCGDRIYMGEDLKQDYFFLYLN